MSSGDDESAIRAEQGVHLQMLKCQNKGTAFDKHLFVHFGWWAVAGFLVCP